MTKKTIQSIEKDAKDAGLSTLYLTTVKTIYATVEARYSDRGKKVSSLKLTEETFNRIERAWALDKRAPPGTASVDVILVQALKDEIAIAGVAKIVEDKHA